MKKIVVLSLIAPAILGLSACGGTTTNTVTENTVTTVEENTTLVDNGTDVVDTNLSDNVVTNNAL